jgi:HTH-type transcriptional regulator / antitoxin HipB
MIQNEHQYKITQGKVKEILHALDTLREHVQTMPTNQISAIEKSFQQQIDDLQVELKEYDDLKAGKLLITLSSIEDLPKVLIQKRISSGMTQRELAEKLSIKEQMIQRYESTAYESISFQRLMEVWNALDASIPMTLVRGEDINDLPKVLIQKRISLGMTQQELAEKVGITKQLLQEYESTAYESISFNCLTRVWNVLEVSMAVWLPRKMQLVMRHDNLSDVYTTKGKKVSQPQLGYFCTLMFYPSAS